MNLAETIHPSVCMVPVRQMLRGQCFSTCFCLTSISQVLGGGRLLLRDRPFKEESRESQAWSCAQMSAPTRGQRAQGGAQGAEVKAALGGCNSPLPWTLTPSTSQIIFLSWVMKSKMRRALGFASEARASPDTQALLTSAEKEEDNEEARNHGLENRWSHQCLHVEGTEVSLGFWIPLSLAAWSL